MENGKDGRNLDESGENRFENIPFLVTIVHCEINRAVCDFTLRVPHLAILSAI
jgi:hypothetical protein